MAILRVCSKYLDDGGGVPRVAQGCCFDELIREPVLLKGFFINPSALRSATTAHIPLGSAMLSDLSEIDGEDAENKTAEAPQSILMTPPHFDRMDEVTGFLSGSLYAHKSPF